MFSTSVRTPTTNTRLTIAPRGVTTYDGWYSPSPRISSFEPVNSSAKMRQATSRLLAMGSRLLGGQVALDFLLHVEMHRLERLGDQHEAEVVGEDVASKLEGPPKEGVLELEVNPLRIHGLARGLDALVEGLSKHALRDRP